MMNKAILEMDEPKSCCECQLSYLDFKLWCAKTKQIVNDYKDKRPSFCPLKIETEQNPKVLLMTEDVEGVPFEFEHYLCPDCKNILYQRHKQSKEPMRYNQKYCHDCGQKLDWKNFVLYNEVLNGGRDG